MPVGMTMSPDRSGSMVEMTERTVSLSALTASVRVAGSARVRGMGNSLASGRRKPAVLGWSTKVINEGGQRTAGLRRPLALQFSRQYRLVEARIGERVEAAALADFVER